MLRAVARGAPGTLWRHIYNVPNPGAGNDITFPVPGHKAWQLLAVSVTLTASAVGGNRLPKLTLLGPGAFTLATVASPTAITAGLAPTVSWTPGVGAATVVAAAYASLTLPDPWYMLPGDALTITGHTGVADTWTNCRVTVLETNSGDPAYERSVERQIQDHWEALHELITT